MNNFISIVNNFNLVIYTDEESSKYIDIKENPRIKLVIKPLESFHNYKYKDYWIQNHEKNFLINDRTCWELNMLWSEKIWFVNDTIQKKHFDTEYYGWCDIGYFRNRHNDLDTFVLQHWPNYDKFQYIDKEKVLYACVRNDYEYINKLSQIIKDKNDNGLPKEQIPTDQWSIAGGFFILYKDKIDWWCQTYDNKLELYFKNNYLVKDDQIIIADCVFSNFDNFTLCIENESQFDNWFMFQRILL
jgi:hypothetical protein